MKAGLHVRTPAEWSKVLLDTSGRVLVVDDHEVVLNLTSMILKRIGFRLVDVAPDGETALKMLSSTGYGLVISDLNMRPMSGLDLLRAIRADERLQEMPVLLMASAMDPAKVGVAMRAGLNGFILKPFTPAVLREKLAAIR